jgi:adenosylhomocysteinase
MQFDIKNIRLAPKGKERIDWAARDMPVLEKIRARFSKEKPLAGVRLAACLHVTTETANLMITLKDGGAEAVLCPSNPLSTQDDVAAALVKFWKIPVFAIHGEDRKTYYRHLAAALAIKPQITLDDGADLVTLLHTKKRHLQRHVWASMEETKTGVIRLQALERTKALRIPVVAVNDALTKYLFDNRYGTGQSTIDGIIRATDMLLAGKTFVVAGYGWCGRGVALRARGMGAHVIVTEVDALKALEAVMDGFPVLPMKEALRRGAQVVVTLTGNRDVVRQEHFSAMANGLVLANSGHFNVEILEALQRAAKSVVRVREHVDEYTLRDGRRVYLLGEGRLVNLACAHGHPASVMDMSFATQSLCAEYVAKNRGKLLVKVHDVPEDIEQWIATAKLASLGFSMDVLTPRQKKYLSDWREGT